MFNVNLYLEPRYNKGDKFSDIRIKLELRSLPAKGDEISFEHWNDKCESKIIPEFIKEIEAYKGTGDKLNKQIAWEQILYEKTIIVTKRIFAPDSNIELRGQLT